ncbi:hypothetical protein, partial [Paenarthrobacter sp. PH39-S1]|uniref:hypothetical protein n=1 Tax=Paenarthrobacter sp. PH39-S1 TaxID=3046204 RepID=UPI0024BB6FD3
SEKVTRLLSHIGGMIKRLERARIPGNSIHHPHGRPVMSGALGPKTDIVDLREDGNGWKLYTRFHDGSGMKPRTIPVPFDLLPRVGTALVDGAIEWIDAEGGAHRMNAVEIARQVLQREWRPGETLDRWHACTLRKFFTYRVEYIGQSYGKDGERTAAERIGEGHKTVQQVLAEKMAHYPNVDVALVVMDAHVQGREASFSIGPDNIDEISQVFTQMMSEADGPLMDRAKLVTVAEAMLIRSFPTTRNIQYKNFPLKDAPTLINELTAAGISHLGVQIDVSRSMALLEHPDEGKSPSAHLRFGVNLSTGERETLSTTSPLAW